MDKKVLKIGGKEYEFQELDYPISLPGFIQLTWPVYAHETDDEIVLLMEDDEEEYIIVKSKKTGHVVIGTTYSIDTLIKAVHFPGLDEEKIHPINYSEIIYKGEKISFYTEFSTYEGIITYNTVPRDDGIFRITVPLDYTGPPITSKDLPDEVKLKEVKISDNFRELMEIVKANNMPFGVNADEDVIVVFLNNYDILLDVRYNTAVVFRKTEHPENLLAIKDLGRYIKTRFPRFFVTQPDNNPLGKTIMQYDLNALIDILNSGEDVEKIIKLLE